VLDDLVEHLVDLHLFMWFSSVGRQVHVRQHVLVAFVPIQPPDQLVVRGGVVEAVVHHFEILVHDQGEVQPTAIGEGKSLLPKDERLPLFCIRILDHLSDQRVVL
jgi:hypothetical protein